jgi:hypothetical protein
LGDIAVAGIVIGDRVAGSNAYRAASSGRANLSAYATGASTHTAYAAGATLASGTL